MRPVRSGGAGVRGCGRARKARFRAPIISVHGWHARCYATRRGGSAIRRPGGLAALARAASRGHSSHRPASRAAGLPILRPAAVVVAISFCEHRRGIRPLFSRRLHSIPPLRGRFAGRNGHVPARSAHAFIRVRGSVGRPGTSHGTTRRWPGRPHRVTPTPSSTQTMMRATEGGRHLAPPPHPRTPAPPHRRTSARP